MTSRLGSATVHSTKGTAAMSEIGPNWDTGVRSQHEIRSEHGAATGNVDRELTRMRQQHGELNELLHRLADRLGPVLLPTRPKEVASDVMVSPESCGLAEYLRVENSSAETMIEFTRDLLDRVDL